LGEKKKLRGGKVPKGTKGGVPHTRSTKKREREGEIPNTRMNTSRRRIPTLKKLKGS